MDQTELRALFPEPEFVEAMGVLEVISQTPEQRDEYISRLKYQLDEAARLQYATEEGEKRGEMIGRISVCQELLGLAQPTRDELSNFDVAKLAQLAEQLQFQLRSRGQ